MSGRARAPKGTAPGRYEPWEGEGFDRAFSLVAFQINRHLVDHMLRVYRTFDMDFEAVMLFGVLAHQNIAHLMPPGAPLHKVLGVDGRLPLDSALLLRPLRVRDLVQITGIPRETVRRKLRYLESKAMICRAEGGWAILPTAISDEFREFTRESVRRLLSTAREVTRTLETAGQTNA